MSTTLAQTLKNEIARISKRETRQQIRQLHSLASRLRKDNAALKRTVARLERSIKTLEAQERRRVAAPAPESTAEGVRFSPAWVRKHRHKVGMSAADYARLIGVHMLTVYKWEHGTSRPRRAQLARWAAVRNLSKREAQRQLELLEGGQRGSRSKKK